MSIFRRVPRAAFLGLSGLVPLYLLVWALLPYIAGERAGLLEDDSYFYAQIAFNSQRYGMFSFDGLQVTSGFHPFWGGILSLVARVFALFTQDKALHLAAYVSVWLYLVVAICFLVSKQKVERTVLFGVALLTAPLMETALLTLLLVLTVCLLTKERRGRWAPVSLGILAFLVPLARIDATPIVVLWLPLVWAQRRWLWGLVCGLLLGVMAHFFLMKAGFGHFATVSSLLKAGVAADRSFTLGALKKIGLAARAIFLIGLMVWGAQGVWSRASDPTERWRRLLLFGAPVAFSLAHVVLGDLRSWHFVPGFTFALWAGLSSRSLSRGDERQGASSSLSRPLALGWGGIVVLVAASALYKSYRFVPLDHVRRASWDFVEMARTRIDTDGRVYQIDGSGFTGFWLGRHLINGDGLVNTYEYAERLRDRRLAGYFEEMQVCFVITDAPLKKKQALIVKQGGLKVRRSEVTELLRSKAYGWSSNQNAHFVLWRLREPRCDSPGRKS